MWGLVWAPPILSRKKSRHILCAGSEVFFWRTADEGTNRKEKRQKKGDREKKIQRKGRQWKMREVRANYPESIHGHDK